MLDLHQTPRHDTATPVFWGAWRWIRDDQRDTRRQESAASERQTHRDAAGSLDRGRKLVVFDLAIAPVRGSRILQLRMGSLPVFVTASVPQVVASAATPTPTPTPPST